MIRAILILDLKELDQDLATYRPWLLRHYNCEDVVTACFCNPAEPLDHLGQENGAMAVFTCTAGIEEVCEELQAEELKMAAHLFKQQQDMKHPVLVVIACKHKRECFRACAVSTGILAANIASLDVPDVLQHNGFSLSSPTFLQQLKNIHDFWQKRRTAV